MNIMQKDRQLVEMNRLIYILVNIIIFNINLTGVAQGFFFKDQGKADDIPLPPEVGIAFGPHLL